MEVDTDSYMEVEVQVDTCSLVYSHQLQIGQRLGRSSVTWIVFTVSSASSS